MRCDQVLDGAAAQFVGTRRFSSVNQFITTSICVTDGGDATDSTMSNRWPSSETSNPGKFVPLMTPCFWNSSRGDATEKAGCVFTSNNPNFVLKNARVIEEPLGEIGFLRKNLPVLEIRGLGNLSRLSIPFDIAIECSKGIDVSLELYVT